MCYKAVTSKEMETKIVKNMLKKINKLDKMMPNFLITKKSS